MTWICGVDGSPAGWVVVLKEVETRRISWSSSVSLNDIRLEGAAPVVIAIDIPIGLTEEGPRQCDLEARKLLGRPRASSVFPAPIRPVLKAVDYRVACRIRYVVEGRRMSMQAFNIMSKIEAVDQELRSNPSLLDINFEVHPEVSFYHLAGGRSMKQNKKRRPGFEERIRLLEPLYHDAVTLALGDRKKLVSGVDYILDAFAALWTAERINRGEECSLPANPPVDSNQLPMRIVY